MRPIPARAAVGYQRWPLTLLVLWLVSTELWWVFALYPIDSTALSWLAVAQQVCFGTGDNGLPALHGWLLLVGGPLSWLAALLVVAGRDLAQAMGAQWRTRGGRVFLALLAAVPLFTAAWSGQRIAGALNYSASLIAAFDPQEGAPPPTVPLDRPAPDFRLTDQRGRTVTLSSLRGRTVWLTFAFGHCETVCPAMLARMAAAREQAPAPPPQAVVISLDPWRDTVASLPAIAAKWNLGTEGIVLSGPAERVNAALDAYHVARERNLRTGDIVHPGLVYVLDPRGRIYTVFNNPTTASLVKAAGEASARQ